FFLYLYYRMIATIEPNTRKFTPQEYFKVLERVNIKIELVNGLLQPKEANAPLPDWVVERVLEDDFKLEQLDFEFPMATTAHGRIIKNIAFGLNARLDEAKFDIFPQDPKVFISLSGRYRIPDVTVAPNIEAQIYQDDCLTNPTVIVEVLSEANRGTDFFLKLSDYKSIESLQEYWLIGQEERAAERFLRQDERNWSSFMFRESDERIYFPSLEAYLSFEEIYKGVE
ncbi:MAG: Uma2 family endonuclease, partial [Bacteroidota bacterium]